MEDWMVMKHSPPQREARFEYGPPLRRSARKGRGSAEDPSLEEDCGSNGGE